MRKVLLCCRDLSPASGLIWTAFRRLGHTVCTLLSWQIFFGGIIHEEWMKKQWMKETSWWIIFSTHNRAFNISQYWTLAEDHDVAETSHIDYFNGLQTNCTFALSFLTCAMFLDLKHAIIISLRWHMWESQNLTRETNILLLSPTVFFAAPLCWHLTTASSSSTRLYRCSLNNTSQIITARMDCK